LGGVLYKEIPYSDYRRWVFLFAREAQIEKIWPLWQTKIPHAIA